MDQDQLTAAALKAAFSSNWQESVDLNEQILKQTPNNLEALNRLGKAQIELDKPRKALSTYRKVLKLDPYNTIAEKNIKKLHNYSKTTPETHNSHFAPTTNFIDEPGITKTIQLIFPGEPNVLAKVDAGDPVVISPKKRYICITTTENQLHLGRIPEDLSLRLISLIKGGNKYQAWIKSIEDQKVKIFIKENHRAPKFESIPSFPDSTQSSYLTFTDPSSLHEDRPDIRSTEEQE